LPDVFHDSFTESVGKQLDARLAATGYRGTPMNRDFVSELLDEHVNDACDDPREAAERIGKAVTLDDMVCANAEFILLHI
jgi:hypothetical protein